MLATDLPISAQRIPAVIQATAPPTHSPHPHPCKTFSSETGPYLRSTLSKPQHSESMTLRGVIIQREKLT